MSIVRKTNVCNCRATERNLKDFSSQILLNNQAHFNETSGFIQYDFLTSGFRESPNVSQNVTNAIISK